MKNALLVGCIIVMSCPLQAQTNPATYFSQPDTLFRENCQDFNEDNFLTAPGGNDTYWVNYDADLFDPQCVEGDPTPGGWYIESDLGQPGNGNDAFTSCSFFDNDPGVSIKNSNWLIMKKVFIPDSNCILSWKSATFLGPAFVDGYKVLVSTSSNIPETDSFTDTLFRASEMLFDPSGEYASLSVADYVYSDGYIHANGYTNPAYFMLTSGFYRGKLEPHEVSLSQYANKEIFIAFLHDSDNDFILQLDEIYVVDKGKSSSTHHISAVSRFDLTPAVCQDQTTLNWQTVVPTQLQLQVSDLAGRQVLSQPLSAGQTTHLLDLSSWQPGVYWVSLQAPGSRPVTRKLIKQRN